MREQTLPDFLVEKIAESSREATPRLFEYAGYNFIVYRSVFSPLHFSSTRIFTDSIQFVPGCSFLEIGCGAGITALVAALSGCRPVVATDISSAAVENTRINVRTHGMGKLVSVRQGDLFDVLKAGELFDIIYWNSNFVYVPPDHQFTDHFHHAFCDAGYASHARFLKEASNYLAPGGALLLGFGSFGDDQLLRSLCSEHGYDVAVLNSKVIDMGAPTNRRYDLLKLAKSNNH